ncbi:TetR-like C-terminal domain-containing protein, partial [Streptomyces sp. NPDC058741]|uniref:TetR-like C-terminal domain-containing protein n=1 Tax=Streptomyces sp. NPDC058741 TaxID=3346620 RepID=UPI0036C28D0A
MGRFAATARCGKSTLHRQWRTKPQFVAAALRSRRRTRCVVTGSPAGDLREAARVVGDLSGRDTQLLHALTHAAQQDPELQRALREAVVEPEIVALKEIIRRGVERGEVAAGHPALEYIPAQVLGVLRLRPVLEGRGGAGAGVWEPP